MNPYHPYLPSIGSDQRPRTNLNPFNLPPIRLLLEELTHLDPHPSTLTLAPLQSLPSIFSPSSQSKLDSIHHSPLLDQRPILKNHSSPHSSQTLSRTKRKQVKRACQNCQKACKGCADSRPCPRCVTHGLTKTCRDAPRKSELINRSTTSSIHRSSSSSSSSSSSTSTSSSTSSSHTINSINASHESIGISYRLRRTPLTPPSSVSINHLFTKTRLNKRSRRSLQA